jgi:mono/diheme cytochrome c family protein
MTDPVLPRTRISTFPTIAALPAGLVAMIAAVLPAQAETLVERGSYLVNTILACGNCHTPKTPDGNPIAEKELSGGVSFTTPAFNAVAANITPDKETGIGNWSDEDIRRALTEGLRPSNARLSGVPLAAVMPTSFYKALLPGDLDAIIAYLHTVKPVRNEVPFPEYKMPVVHQPYPDAERGFTVEDMKNPVRLGAYLATIGHCMECHSVRDKGVSNYVSGLGAGGRQFEPSMVHGVQADWKGSTARNITSHPNKGLGAWSDDEIKRAITSGISRDGKKLGPPMAFGWYANLRDDDLSALVAWLRTVPARE